MELARELQFLFPRVRDSEKNRPSLGNSIAVSKSEKGLRNEYTFHRGTVAPNKMRMQLPDQDLSQTPQ